MGGVGRAVGIVVLLLLLGVASNVAIAWLATVTRVPMSAPSQPGPGPWRMAIVHAGATVRIDAMAAPGAQDESVTGSPVALPSWSVLHEAPEDAHHVHELAAGWPLPSLRYAGTAPHRSPLFAPLDFEHAGAIVGHDPRATTGRGTTELMTLPVQPIWRNFAVNTALLALGWFVLLRLPYPWRLARAVGRVRRQRCPACDYDLRGIESDRCPECGGHRHQRPPLVPRGVTVAIVMLVLTLALVEIGVAASVRMSRIYEPIHLAAYDGDVAGVRAALMAGTAVDLPVPDHAVPAGVTPLWLAAAAGHGEVVRILADRGADVNRRSLAFGTPVDIAARRGHVDAVRLLVDLGAAADAGDAVGVTPLMRAAEAGEPETIEALLALGADPEAQSAGGITALHLAASYGRVEVVSRLLDGGADPMTADRRGETALAKAVERGRTMVIDLLLERGVTPGPPAIVEAVNEARLDLLERFVAHGADLEAADASTAGLLFYAPFDPSSREVWRLLVRHGANVNAQLRGRTILMSAARRGSAEFVRFLLEHGADPTLRDQRGRTALDYAQGDRAEIIRRQIESDSPDSPGSDAPTTP
jgi:ankyrin repeat protein